MSGSDAGGEVGSLRLLVDLFLRGWLAHGHIAIPVSHAPCWREERSVAWYRMLPGAPAHDGATLTALALAIRLLATLSAAAEVMPAMPVRLLVQELLKGC